MAHLRKVEPFPTRGDELKPYEAAYVRGWVVERYQVDLRKASELNLQQMEAAVDSSAPARCRAIRNVTCKCNSVPGPHLQARPRPCMVVTTYGPKNYQIVVNGYTGAIAGDRPLSYVKVFFYIILPILIFLLLVLFSQH